MKRINPILLIFTACLFTASSSFGQRIVGGSQVDLDDNAGNHVFLTTSGSSFGVNATGIAPNTNAILDLNSTSKGLLLPRLTALQEAGLTATGGMTVYNSTSKTIDFYNGVSWMNVNGGWSLAGNSGTNPAVNYLGTNDIQDFVIRTAATERLRVLSGGNLTLSSSPGIALSIVGPAATSINAAGTIQTAGTVSGGALNSNGNLTVTGTSQFGPTGTPVKSVYKLTIPSFIGAVPANSTSEITYIGFFNANGSNPTPGVGDAVYIYPDPGLLPAGLIINAWMVASDQVLIRVANVTGGAIALGAGNFTVIATRF